MVLICCGLVALVVGLVLLVGGLTARPRDGVRVGAGALALLFLAVPVVSEWRYYSAVNAFEWNPGMDGPPIRRDRVVGTWAAGPSRLVLRPDGSFQLALEGEAEERIGARTAEGMWTLNDWNLDLTASEGTGERTPLRVVVVREDGSYRIIDGRGVGDDWRPWGGLSRLSPEDS
ncbi:MAG TPA: hypothetical protein VGB53_02290 [Rubricoccaceae bacterium]|jgi:hypothetical protein